MGLIYFTYYNKLQSHLFPWEWCSYARCPEVDTDLKSKRVQYFHTSAIIHSCWNLLYVNQAYWPITVKIGDTKVLTWVLSSLFSPNPSWVDEQVVYIPKASTHHMKAPTNTIFTINGSRYCISDAFCNFINFHYKMQFWCLNTTIFCSSVSLWVVGVKLHLASRNPFGEINK